ncbi:MAG TPA: DUF4062 domain-containing protein, partial [Gemmataceae bacterium]|nr:DUF4062 domain-containing protein [Gemmataceae bacterium]
MAPPRSHRGLGGDKPAVMISSTSLDLPVHREMVSDAILRVGFHPLDMKHGSALHGSNAIRFSLDLVERAELYVGIFGHRYGHVPEDATLNPRGLSVTELEYRRAVERGIPVFVYLMHDKHPVTIADVEDDSEKKRKLNALKDELKAGAICGFFASPEELRTLAIQSLYGIKLGRQTEDAPDVARGARADLPRPPEPFYSSPYTLMTSRFVGRRQELADLDAWAASADTVMVVEAIGGMGKSALTWEWLHRPAATAVRGLAGRVWWSFYEGGTSMSEFIRHSLAYVRGQDVRDLKELSPFECAELLLAELRREPYLLVLDGFERVLTAYHRLEKAHIRDERVEVDLRDCTNPRDGDLLRRLVDSAPSKILISSRLMPRGLEDRASHLPMPRVRHLSLEGLAEADALEVMHNAVIRGDWEAMRRFVDQFARHALILTIVCGQIADYRARPGDFDAWVADPYAGGGLKLSGLEVKQRYTHILAYAFRGLEEKKRQLLSRIAVLSDSADYATIAVLNPYLPPRPEEVPEPDDPFETYEWTRLGFQLRKATSEEARARITGQMQAFRTEKQPEYEGQLRAHRKSRGALQAYLVSAEYRKAMSDFDAALKELEDRGLLRWDRVSNTYDLHPVVRGYAFDRLEQQDRTRTYDTIRDHVNGLPREAVDEATELAHLKNSIEIYRAFVGAGRFDDAVRF